MCERMTHSESKGGSNKGNETHKCSLVLIRVDKPERFCHILSVRRGEFLCPHICPKAEAGCDAEAQQNTDLPHDLIAIYNAYVMHYS